MRRIFGESEKVSRELNVPTIQLGEIDPQNQLPSVVAEIKIPCTLLGIGYYFVVDQVDVKSYPGYAVYAFVRTNMRIGVSLSTFEIVEFNVLGTMGFVCESAEQFLGILEFVATCLFETKSEWSDVIDDVMDGLLRVGFPRRTVREGYWLDIFSSIAIGDVDKLTGEFPKSSPSAE